MWVNIIVLAVTIMITSLIVLGLRWIDRNKAKYPEVYAHRGFIRFTLWLILTGASLLRSTASVAELHPALA